MFKKIVLTILLIFSISFAKSYKGYKYNVFFGSMGSARSEAMGRILSVDEQSFSFLSNPANLTNSKNLYFSYSNSDYIHFGGYKSDYHFSGIKYNYKDNYLGLNFLYIPTGSGHMNANDNPNYKIISLSYAKPLFNFINIGIRSNILIDNIVKDNKKVGNFWDFGLTKSIGIYQSQKIKDHFSIGLQYSNIFNQEMDLEYSKLLFPSVFRVGLKNDFYYSNSDVWSDAYIFKLSTAIEYQNITNSDYFDGIRYGMELGFLDMLFSRYGYYDISQIQNYDPIDKAHYNDSFKEKTFGFGVKLEVQRYFTNFIPININLDFTKLEIPYVCKHAKRKNFSIFEIGINYIFE